MAAAAKQPEISQNIGYLIYFYFCQVYDCSLLFWPLDVTITSTNHQPTEPVTYTHGQKYTDVIAPDTQI